MCTRLARPMPPPPPTRVVLCMLDNLLLCQRRAIGFRVEACNIFLTIAPRATEGRQEARRPNGLDDRATFTHLVKRIIRFFVVWFLCCGFFCCCFVLLLGVSTCLVARQPGWHARSPSELWGSANDPRPNFGLTRPQTHVRHTYVSLRANQTLNSRAQRNRRVCSNKSTHARRTLAVRWRIHHVCACECGYNRVRANTYWIPVYRLLCHMYRCSVHSSASLAMDTARVACVDFCRRMFAPVFVVAAPVVVQ